MEYNTQRGALVIPEYGRNVQKMVDYCLTITDKTKRTAYANDIIVAMSQVNPAGKDTSNYKQKLWDHLFIISDYKLDVDSPFDKPKREDKFEVPKNLAYKNSDIKFRTYGINIQHMIDKVATMEEGEEKRILSDRLAQELKRTHLQWNINTCDDGVILKHLDILSSGKVKVSDNFQFKSNKELIGKQPIKNQPKKKKNKQK